VFIWLVGLNDCRPSASIGGFTQVFETASGKKSRTCGFLLERVMGIEPTYSAWEADVLPLNYTRGMKAF
jgi:hypothetical protein